MAIVDASLTPIYQRLNGVDESHPYEAKTFSDWSMEAGDMVKIKRGSDEYSSPVHNLRLIWTGAPQATVSSGGNKNRAPVATQAKRNYGRGGSGLRSSQGLGHKIEETDEHWQSMYWDGYNGLSSRIEQTASYWQAEFNNMYDGLRGFVEITAEHWEAEFQNAYAGLVGYVEVTAEHWQTAFENAYAGLVGYVEVTAEHWEAQFQSAYEGLVGYVEMTDQHWTTVFTDSYNGLVGYVDATADHWMSVLENTESGLRSSIQQQANRIGLVVEGTGDNAHIKAAEIVASINDQTGESQVRLAADKVLISGTTKLNDVFTVTDDYVRALVSIYAAPGAVFNGDHVGSFYYSRQEQGHSVPYGILKKAEVDTSTNTLKIWKFGDADDSPSITFRKAASTKVSGSWSGGIITVSADENGDDSYVRSFGRGTVSWQGDKKAANVYVNVIRTSGGSEYVDVADAFSIYVPTTDSYNAGWDYGLTKRVRTTAEATSQELTIKALSYGQRWTIKDTYTASNGTTSDVKYTVAAPTDSNIVAGNIKSGVTIFGVTGNYGGNHSVTLTWNGSTGTNAGSTNNIKGVCSTATTYDYIKMYSSSGTIYVRHNTSASAVESSGTIIAKLTDGNLSAGNIKNGVSIFGVSGNYTGTHSVTLTWNGTTGSNAGSTNNIKGTCGGATTYNYIKMYSSSGTVYVRHNTSASAVESSGTIIAKLTDGNLSAGNIKNGVTIFGVTGSYAGTTGYTLQQVINNSWLFLSQYQIGENRGEIGPGQWVQSGTALEGGHSGNDSWWVNGVDFDSNGNPNASSYIMDPGDCYRVYTTGPGGTLRNVMFQLKSAAANLDIDYVDSAEECSSTATIVSLPHNGHEYADVGYRDSENYWRSLGIAFKGTSGGTTYSHSASIKCTNHSQETHGTVTVHTYTYTQSINSANPIVGVGNSRTVYWP